MNFNNYKSAPLSFNDPEVMQSFINSLFRFFDKANLNPFVTEEWKKGLFQLFGVQTVNYPYLEKRNYILASNHISDFDALILGLLHPKIRIIAKIGWATNKELMDFLKLHYDIVGIFRSSEIDRLSESESKAAKEHNFQVLRDISNYLKDTSEVHHLLIFPQGTISDINKNSKERVSPGFAKMANATKTDVIDIFTEYPEIDGSMRVVFGTPYPINNRHTEHSQAWLNNVIALQNQLDNIREPILSHKHALNNNPDEPFF